MPDEPADYYTCIVRTTYTHVRVIIIDQLYESRAINLLSFCIRRVDY